MTVTRLSPKRIRPRPIALYIIDTYLTRKENVKNLCALIHLSKRHALEEKYDDNPLICPTRVHPQLLGFFVYRASIFFWSLHN